MSESRIVYIAYGYTGNEAERTEVLGIRTSIESAEKLIKENGAWSKYYPSRLMGRVDSAVMEDN